MNDLRVWVYFRPVFSELSEITDANWYIGKEDKLTRFPDGQDIIFCIV